MARVMEERWFTHRGELTHGQIYGVSSFLIPVYFPQPFVEMVHCTCHVPMVI